MSSKRPLVKTNLSHFRTSFNVAPIIVIVVVTIIVASATPFAVVLQPRNVLQLNPILDMYGWIEKEVPPLLSRF